MLSCLGWYAVLAVLILAEIALVSGGWLALAGLGQTQLEKLRQLDLACVSLIFQQGSLGMVYGNDRGTKESIIRNMQGF